MKKLVLVSILALSSVATAAGGHMFGFSASAGLPYTSEFGLNYLHSSNMLSVELGYGSINLDASSVSVGLAKTELSLRWHPFAGAFFLGAGVGQQTLSAKSTQVISAQSIDATIEITSNTITPQVGWMWGIADGGFYGGVDFGFQRPSGATTKLTTNADAIIQATSEYQQLETDVRDQGQKFGEAGLPILTFIRLGYLF